MNDTIAALAAGGGAGAISIIRISGPDCFEQASGLFTNFPSQSHKLVLTNVVDAQGCVIDEGLVCKFVGKKSYTGENTIEIHCHGGAYIASAVLELIFGLGIRQAQPGEFTQRAYLNGKLDLLQAEGINLLVTAKSKQEWQAGQYLKSSDLSNLINDLKRRLIESMALIEAQIDFPEEHDVAHLNKQAAKDKIAEVSKVIGKLVGTYNSGKVVSHGLRVGLYGEPNAGKSTLLNALLGEERAIVTDVAGTTRDYIEEAVLLDGRLVKLVDTAGIRQSAGDIEKIGIERSLKILDSIDLVVHLLPKGGADNVKLRDELKQRYSGEVLEVVSKGDLDGAGSAGPVGALEISAKTGQGLDSLKDHIIKKVDACVADASDNAYITNSRQLAALNTARGNLEQFFELYEQDSYDELLAFEVRQATKSLSSVLGNVDSEDILEEIFSKFCIGK